jgi:hypothetical protein
MEWPCNKCKYKPMKEARAAAKEMQSQMEYRERATARRRSEGGRRNAWLGSMARGAREEVAWNGYSNTEEGPALFFGRQPGRAAPDGRN